MRTPRARPERWQLGLRRFFYAVGIYMLGITVLLVFYYLLAIWDIRQAWRADSPSPAVTATEDPSTGARSD